MATLLDGRALAAELRHELKEKIAALGFTPTLGVVLVGNDPASHLYVKLKEQAAAEVGMAVEKVLLPGQATLDDIVGHVERFNGRTDVHGILVQLPLPPHIDEHAVIAKLDPNKDADGFCPLNLARFLAGERAVTPGVSAGIMRLIELAKQNLTGGTAIILANSQEFALPLTKLLRDKGMRVVVMPEPNADTLRTAKIIVVATGRPGLLTNNQVRDGAIVIDVGTTKVGSHVVGDAAAELKARNIYLTPVPGGVGPMTVVMLLWNVYRLAAARRP